MAAPQSVIVAVGQCLKKAEAEVEVESAIELVGRRYAAAATRPLADAVGAELVSRTRERSSHLAAQNVETLLPKAMSSVREA